MKKKTKAKKTRKATNPAGTGRSSRRIKCACAPCNCMVDMDKGLRKGNLLFCSRACMTREHCSLMECYCGHDECKP